MRLLDKFKNMLSEFKYFCVYYWVEFKFEILKIRFKILYIIGSFMIFFDCKYWEAYILVVALLLLFVACICKLLYVYYKWNLFIQ